MIDPVKLNDARWAACNTRYPDSVPSMEWATELADKIVAAYPGMSPDEWQELVNSAHGA